MPAPAMSMPQELSVYVCLREFLRSAAFISCAHNLICIKTARVTVHAGAMPTSHRVLPDRVLCCAQDSLCPLRSCQASLAADRARIITDTLDEAHGTQDVIRTLPDILEKAAI
jgi:hypothetical protein